jgi:rare lipoprotein A
MRLKKLLSLSLILFSVSCASRAPQPEASLEPVPYDFEDARPFVDSPVITDITPEGPEPVVVPGKKYTFQHKEDIPLVKYPEETRDERLPDGVKASGVVFDRPYTLRGETYHRFKYVESFVQEGIASWYGYPDHGKPTASGEKYNMYAMTAAHKNLPLGSVVEVENLENGQKTKVTVNDRGPHVAGRIIDLSKMAASRIGIVDKGTAKVRVTLLEPAGEKTDDGYEYAENSGFSVQLASFTDRGMASSLADSLNGGRVEKAVVNGTTYFRVKVSGFESKESAESYRAKMMSKYPGAFVVTY